MQHLKLRFKRYDHKAKIVVFALLTPLRGASPLRSLFADFRRNQ
jgi:hypothetical protein